MNKNKIEKNKIGKNVDEAKVKEVEEIEKFVKDKKDMIMEKVIEGFREKLKREARQVNQFQRYLKEAKKTAQFALKEKKKLWEKLAKELNSGISLNNLKTKTKYRIFSHYRFLIINIARKYIANPYLTPLELIRAGEKGLWKTIEKFGYELLNEILPQNKKFSDKEFKNKGCKFYINKAISDAINYERQKILGYPGLSVFIYRNKAGRVTKIHLSGTRKNVHVLEEFIGTDKEKQEFAEKYEREEKELMETERRLNLLISKKAKRNK